MKRQMEEIKRRVRSLPIRIDKEPEQDMLYHYTHVEGLLGILDSRSIWVTKSDFLNDYSELAQLSRVFVRLLEEMKNTPGPIGGSQSFRDMLHRIGGVIQNRMWLEEDDLFVLSLTHHGDSYPLWSNFGNLQGYNIQFEYSRLLEVWEEENIIPAYMGRIVYSEEEQIRVLREELQQTYRIWREAMGQADKPEGEGAPIECRDETWKDGLEEVEEELLNRLKIYSIFFKDPCFADEKEYRTVFTAARESVRFRLRGGAVLPYIEVPAGRKDTTPIFRITIGPVLNIDIAEKGLNYYLKVKGHRDASVKKSRIPLRY